MKTQNAKCWAVVPAAGIGKRMESDIPKQYLLIDNKPVLFHTLQRLFDTQLFEGIVLVLSAHDTQGERIAKQFPNTRLALGGELRFDSVYSGLQALNTFAHSDDFIFVHDAARPCVTSEDIIKLYRAIQHDPVGGILGYPVRDTLKQVRQHHIERTVDRALLWHALTPQAFRYNKLLQAMQICMPHKHTITDDASCMEQVGLHPQMIQGRSDNIKITYPQDLKFMEEPVCE